MTSLGRYKGARSPDTERARRRALRSRPAFRVLCMALCLCIQIVAVAVPTQAAWRTQEIELTPGWNAVYLEVQPDPSDIATVFDGLPVESVWAWNRSYSPVQFVQDASTLLPGQPEWLSFFPFNPAPGGVTTLFGLRAGHAYLINVSGAQPVTWTVRGRVGTPTPQWVADSLNLVGFPVDPNQPPTFSAVLGGSSAHSPAQVHRLASTGQWVPVGNPSTERMRRGEAYWINVNGASTYPGPIEVVLEQANEVNFGRLLTEQTVRIRNHAGSARQVRIATATAEEPPGGIAGPVPLSWWDAPSREWIPLTTLQQTVEPGAEFALRVAVRRVDMVASSNPTAPYAGVLEISDGAGLRLAVPVAAKGRSAGADEGAGGVAGVGEGVDPRAGLWVGAAAIDQVSHAAADRQADRAIPVPAGSEFQFRLIVHVDASGQPRLLQHVTLMHKDGTRKPDPTDPSKTVVDQPGRQVLIADDDLLTSFTGIALRDGEPVGKRISSAAFAFSEPQPMSGGFDGTLRLVNLPLPYDDRLNPFVHRYHPNHDNLNARFEAKLPEGRESYSVFRTIELAFSAADPDGLNRAGWGDAEVGGTYRERIVGLHREVLHVSGTFRLQHVSRVAILDDGQ